MSEVDINIDDPRDSEDIYRCMLHDLYILRRREPENRDKWQRIEALIDRCRFDLNP